MPSLQFSQNLNKLLENMLKEQSTFTELIQYICSEHETHIQN